MKKLSSIIGVWLGLCLLSFSQLTYASGSPIEHLNVSIWSEYKRNNFDGLSQSEKTEKLQKIFEDKLAFVQKHKVRRLIVKILDPSNFEFFHPEKFDSNSEDNFYFWANQLAQFVEVEALFDKSEFRFKPATCSDTLCGYYEAFVSRFKTLDKPFGSFENLVEKLDWLSRINKSYLEQNQTVLVREVVINPEAIGDDSTYQNLINALDQYRSNASPLLPENVYPELRLGFQLKMDQKSLAMSNLARFPLQTDIKSEKQDSLGLKLASSFPSTGPEYPAPEWRPDEHHALLDTVYLQLHDPRFISCIYQSPIFSDPSKYSAWAAKSLSHSLGKNFRGEPIVKGPGVVNNEKGTTTLTGMYTNFRTGDYQTFAGQFVSGQIIEVRPPYVTETVQKTVSGDPENNRKLQLSSPLSTKQDVVEAEYFQTAVPVTWITPYVTHELASKIYFVFSTEFNPKGEQYFGNWSLANFLSFLLNLGDNSGFLRQPLFMQQKGHYLPVFNNIVLYDYSMLPNGNPYPEFDWGLGNKTH